MNWLGVWIFILVLMVVAGAVVYIALFKKKEKKEEVCTNGCEAKISDPDIKQPPPCTDCDAAIVPNNPANINIKLELIPNNPPEVPAGVFCTRTLSITANETITGWNGQGITIQREWYDNEVLRETNTNMLTGFFGTNHIIKYKVMIGDVWATVQARIT